MYTYLKIYRERGLNPDIKSLIKLISRQSKLAKDQYQKLSTPKTMSEGLYVHAWVRNAVIHDIYENIKIIRPEHEYKASIDFYLAFPNSLRKKLRKDINSATLDQRAKVWNKYKLDFKKIEKTFIALTIQRNTWAKQKGFKNFLEEKLKHYKIPRKDYELFKAQTNNLIKYCNSQLPKIKLPSIVLTEFTKPCYLCLSTNFPFTNLEETINFVFGEYEILQKFKKKIKIKFTDYSEMSYNVQDDSFEISIEKDTNLRHQSLAIIHELIHVVNHIESYKRGFLPSEKGNYFQEKETLKKEIPLLKKISPVFYKSIFSEFLKVFQQVLFEIELYNNPNQNLSKLYADVYNLCYPQANQKQNRSFILNKDIVEQPLSILPNAIAQSIVIKKYLKLNTSS